ncbi:MAG: hypothetical protein K0Q49_1276 [Haloplasmataceae bacterium]|jgi:hypothetical protein|nr:hypothetical protein [Haloplasmataceae bacterium]
MFPPRNKNNNNRQVGGYYQGYQQPPGFPGTGLPTSPGQSNIGTGFPTGTGIDARLDRLEREIIDINRKINNISRRLRKVENQLNIRDEE